MFQVRKYIYLFLIGITIGLAIGSYFYLKLRADRNRLYENFAQTENENQVLKLTQKELENSNASYAIKLDSVLKANKIKPKQVKSATIINTVYKDTTITEIVYLPPRIEPKKGFLIPVQVNGFCWGMKGEILTADSTSELRITERSSNNSAQLIVKKKLFLGFLWATKKTEYKAYSDCGEVNFTQIDIVK